VRQRNFIAPAALIRFPRLAGPAYLALCRRCGAAILAPTRAQVQGMLFSAGLLLLVIGIAASAAAHTGGHHTQFNDVRLAEATTAMLTYIEGTFGAMVMVCAGIGAIMSAAFGQYRPSLGLLVVALGSFILRSLVGTFFNDNSLPA
jgi:uncharacterized paraquat-inducible protein A